MYTAGSSHKRQREPGYMYMALFSVCKQTQTGYQLYLKTVAHSLILKFPWQKVNKGPASLVCFCMHALYLELYTNTCCCFLFQMFNMLKWWGWSVYEDEVLGMRLEHVWGWGLGNESIGCMRGKGWGLGNETEKLVSGELVVDYTALTRWTIIWTCFIVEIQ